jgi:hypothetical protein
MGKNKANKRIIRLANKIAELENEIRQGKNVEAAQSEIEKITATLSFEEMMEIDERILNKHKIK